MNDKIILKIGANPKDVELIIDGIDVAKYAYSVEVKTDLDHTTIEIGFHGGIVKLEAIIDDDAKERIFKLVEDFAEESS